MNNSSTKPLVVYFSRAGENYAVGNITKGNTAIVAEMIAELTGANIFEVVPQTPYPDNYDECTALAQREEREGTRPAITGDYDTAPYDKVFVCYPIWWDDLPMPLHTFIDKHDWEGKTVIPVSTHEGSGLGSTPAQLRAACKGAAIAKGLAIRGLDTQRNLPAVRTSIEAFLKTL